MAQEVGISEEDLEMAVAALLVLHTDVDESSEGAGDELG